MADKKEIQLTSMPQLAEAQDKEDDWTGLADATARRKRQNRLNQRAYRRRKALTAQPATSSNLAEISRGGTTSTEIRSSSWNYHPPSLPVVIPRENLPTTPLIPYISSSNSNPNLQTIFPLPCDHLLTLIQYNVLRAILSNMSLLSLLHCIPEECGGAMGMPILPTPIDIPPSLAPTPLQRSIPHDIAIDIVPFQPMRDNMIMLTGKYDHDELCSDLVGGLFEGFNDLEMRGVLVWADPWHPSGWEVTEGFVKKWGFLLKGCRELVEATNKWRELRNEDKLIIEV